MDLYEWTQVVKDTYNIRFFLFIAEKDGRDVGFLSLSEIKHPLFGHYLLTAPFGTAGGWICKDEEAIGPLSMAAKALADQLKADYLLIRAEKDHLPGFVLESRYQTALLDLSKGEDFIWNKQIDVSARNQTRKAMKQNFEVLQSTDQMPAFFDVFHRHMRDLGSPAHSMSFYKSIFKYFPKQMDIFVLKDGARVIAGSLVLSVNGTVSNLHTVALRAYNSLCPNNLIYWKMIQSAVAAGAHTFDMGRSVEGGGNIGFKKQWGPRLIPLAYNYYLRRGTEVPFLDPRNSKYGLAIAMWRKIPVFLTKRLGPLLIPGLG